MKHIAIKKPVFEPIDLKIGGYTFLEGFRGTLLTNKVYSHYNDSQMYGLVRPIKQKNVSIYAIVHNKLLCGFASNAEFCANYTGGEIDYRLYRICTGSLRYNYYSISTYYARKKCLEVAKMLEIIFTGSMGNISSLYNINREDLYEKIVHRKFDDKDYFTKLL